MIFESRQTKRKSARDAEKARKKQENSAPTRADLAQHIQQLSEIVGTLQIAMETMIQLSINKGVIAPDEFAAYAAALERKLRGLPPIPVPGAATAVNDQAIIKDPPHVVQEAADDSDLR
ncbi:MAG: hypothetical protein JEZ11_17845 [Desulfobacterales bacterium]|nr:hypothetical protein [Desulfobacterales bacterium]